MALQEWKDVLFLCICQEDITNDPNEFSNDSLTKKAAAQKDEESKALKWSDNVDLMQRQLDFSKEISLS